MYKNIRRNSLTEWMMMMMMMIALTRTLQDAASSLGSLAMSNLLYLVLGVCTTDAGSISR